MVLSNSNKDKFLRSELEIGILDRNILEPTAPEYKRVTLSINLFDEEQGKYINNRTIAFEEAQLDYGDIYYVAVFDEGRDKMLAHDYIGPRTVSKLSTLIFSSGDFEIGFE